MESIKEFFSLLYQFDQLIRWGGYAVLISIVFAETGLLAGFFLPGDSLLVTAGILAAVDGALNFWVLLGSLSAAAIVGDTVGYWIGFKIGPKIFNKDDSFFFKKSHILRTQHFYEKYGAKTIVLARFVPIVRTFAPTLAGVGRMKYRKFLIYNIAGGIGWVLGMVGLGYFVASRIPNIEKRVHYVILVVIFVSFLPIVNEWWQSHRKKGKPQVSPPPSVPENTPAE